MTRHIPMVFRDRTGLSLDSFNTIRLGTGWSKRVGIGDVVVCMHKGVEVCSMSVSGIALGTVEAMLPLHAQGNHIELGMRLADPSYDPNQAVSRRLKSMIRNYGSNRVRSDSPVTVLKLERMSGR